MFKFLGRLAFGTVMLFPAPMAFAEDVAVIISNFDARGFGNRAVTEREIGTVESAYRADGFRVISGRNLKPDQMRDRLREFENSSSNADRVVIHFVGEILPSDDNARLRPFGFDSASLVQRDYAAPSLDLLYELIDHRPGRAVLVLATPTKNVGRMVETGPHIPNGVTVFAGPARDLNRRIRDNFLGNDEHVTRMQARPLISAFGYLPDAPFASSDPVQAQAQIPNATPDPQQSAAASALEEMRVWREATQNGSEAALQGYLSRYPNGLFKGEAEARIEALKPKIPIEVQIENALRLTREDRRNIQRDLTVLGFDTRGVDGVMGRGTRGAIRNWQRGYGFTPSGYLDAKQIEALVEASRIKREDLKAQKEREDIAFWQSRGAGSTEQGAREYLERFPDGLFAVQARAALENFQKQRAQRDNVFVDRERALGLNQQTRTLVEQRLAGLGYKVGRVDGNFTEETRRAIRAFQQRAGMEPTGFLDEKTVTNLVASIFR